MGKHSSIEKYSVLKRYFESKRKTISDISKLKMTLKQNYSRAHRETISFNTEKQN